jgi:hypothetical protein
MSVLNGAKPAWGKRVDPLFAVFDLVEGDAVARPITVLATWLLVTTIAGALLTRHRPVT